MRASLRGEHRRFARWVGRIGRYDARPEPGPYAPRTIEMGNYLGLRADGRLVAMAGERLRPPGWTEISAVCTDAEFRGRGFATRLVRAVGAGIRARDETPSQARHLKRVVHYARPPIAEMVSLTRRIDFRRASPVTGMSRRQRGDAR
ncbi:GNAT family N-acetyltransferase [Nocardia arthritidis]|uniref:GNAT family N-acetyltransferase n=1 Tax=Nocardia arthritidis TaxID=228602 RepID=UPI000A91A257|nr:GNAT family N-acetyltransferase [Nocardia arthritidis]